MEHFEASPTAGGESRRDFIKKTATAAAVVASSNIFKTPVYGQSQAPSTGKVIGANDRIVVAYVGVGNQGMAHVKSQQTDAAANNIAQAAVCDLSTTRVENAKKAIGGNVEGYTDHRKLLEQKDIDAVTVATVDHWHAAVSMDVMNSGKHVYCEKPMTRYLDEAWEVHDTVKKTGRVFQIGSQICSDARWHKAAALIKDGSIGPLVLGQDSYMRNAGLKGEWNYDVQAWCTPDDLDWNRWQGPVHNRVPFNADHYFRWRKYLPYCAGLLGDLFPHRLHPLMMATGNPEFPKRVVCLGTRKISTDRDVNDDTQVLAEFPSGLILMVTSSTVNEQGLPSMIRGFKGTLYFGGDRVELRPERPFADEVDPELFANLKPAGEKISEMEKNWFDSIRSGTAPYGNIDLAIRVQTVITLAEMAERLNLVCLFDEKSRKITTDGGREVTPITYGTMPLS